MFGEIGEFGWIGLSDPLDMHHYDNPVIIEEVQRETFMYKFNSRKTLVKYFDGLRIKLFGEDKKWKSLL